MCIGWHHSRHDWLMTSSWWAAPSPVRALPCTAGKTAVGAAIHTCSRMLLQPTRSVAVLFARSAAQHCMSAAERDSVRKEHTSVQYFLHAMPIRCFAGGVAAVDSCTACVCLPSRSMGHHILLRTRRQPGCAAGTQHVAALCVAVLSEHMASPLLHERRHLVN